MKYINIHQSLISESALETKEKRCKVANTVLIHHHRYCFVFFHREFSITRECSFWFIPIHMTCKFKDFYILFDFSSISSMILIKHGFLAGKPSKISCTCCQWRKFNAARVAKSLRWSVKQLLKCLYKDNKTLMVHCHSMAETLESLITTTVNINRF